MRSFAALRMTERSSLSPLGRAIVRRVPAETTTKALLIAVHADPAPCVATINRLNPEHLCFFIPEELRPKIETDIQPNLAKLPKKRSEEHTSELQSLAYLVCRLLLEKK